MHIRPCFNHEKVDIDKDKVDIGRNGSVKISKKTLEHINVLYLKYRDLQYFGRTLVEEAIGVKSSTASKLLRLMLEIDIIEPVKGHGKGQYRFKEGNMAVNESK